MENLYSLDEALDYLNETSLCEEAVILEFNVKDTIHNMIEKVKAAFVSLINKIQSHLAKCKDSKLKSAINKVLQKAKEGLTKANSIKEEDDEKSRSAIEELKNAYGELSTTFRMVTAPISQTTITTTELKSYIDNLKNKGFFGGDKVALFGYEDSVFDKNFSKMLKKSKFEAEKNYKPGHNVVFAIYDKKAGTSSHIKKWKDMDSELDKHVQEQDGCIVIADK